MVTLTDSQHSLGTDVNVTLIGTREKHPWSTFFHPEQDWHRVASRHTRYLNRGTQSGFLIRGLHEEHGWSWRKRRRSNHLLWTTGMRCWPFGSFRAILNTRLQQELEANITKNGEEKVEKKERGRFEGLLRTPSKEPFFAYAYHWQF